MRSAAWVHSPPASKQCRARTRPTRMSRVAMLWRQPTPPACATSYRTTTTPRAGSRMRSRCPESADEHNSVDTDAEVRALLCFALKSRQCPYHGWIVCIFCFVFVFDCHPPGYSYEISQLSLNSMAFFCWELLTNDLPLVVLYNVNSFFPLVLHAWR